KDAIEGQKQTLQEKNKQSLTKLQLGVAKTFVINDKFDVLAAAQLNTEFYQTQALINTKGLSIQPSVGFEVGYSDIVFVRGGLGNFQRSEEHTSELQSRENLVCRLLLEKKKI